MSPLLKLIDFQPEGTSFRDEVLAGLSAPRKRVSPKFLYDRRGSRLFEMICELPEYYPTRVESAILAENAPEIAREIGPEAALLELGSGSSRKTRLLLDHLERPSAYIPLDISREVLLRASGTLARDYPSIRVAPVCADFTQRLALPGSLFDGSRRRAAFFPGSTIGNFEPAEAERLLSRAADLVGPGGLLLLGVDLTKDPGVLERAYDDRRGVTAEFNQNLLHRMRAELGADVDIAAFRHRAFYDREAERIEMHLVSLRKQTIRIQGAEFGFRGEETIHTESSYKFRLPGVERLARATGFEITRTWSDAREYFAVVLLQAIACSGLGCPSR